jgi:hypothetical protein
MRFDRPQPENLMNRSAKWIWLARQRDAVDCHLLARRSFTLPAAPSGATLQITACDRYRLFVNGRRVGDGPPRSEWPEIYLDTYRAEDLRSSLTTPAWLSTASRRVRAACSSNSRPGAAAAP